MRSSRQRTRANGARWWTASVQAGQHSAAARRRCRPWVPWYSIPTRDGDFFELAIERRVESMTNELELRAHLDLADRLAPAKIELDRVRSATEALQLQEVELVERARTRTQEIDRADRAIQAQDAEVERARQEAETIARTAEQQRTLLETARAATADAELTSAREVARADAIRKEITEFAARLGAEFEAVGSYENGHLRSFARHLLAVMGPETGARVPIFPSASPPWWEDASTVPMITIDELPERLREEAVSHGLVLEDLVLVDAFARAGELVVLTGEQSGLTLESYVRAVGGGHVRTVSLDPGIIGVDDLWRTPVTGRSTALAWAWRRASEAPDESVVVCLQGIDMSPARIWLPALDRALQSDRRPRNLIVLATIAARPDEDDVSDRVPSKAWLTQHAVALHVRAERNGGLAAAVLGDELRTATNLVYGAARYEPPYRSLRSIADGRSPRVIRRAIRLLKVLGEIQPSAAGPLAQGWARLLSDDVADGLPAPVAGGLDDISRVRFLE